MKRIQCPICQEPFANFNAISALACGHCFHLGCVNTWLSQPISRKQCPSCRKKSSTIINQLFFSEFDDDLSAEDDVDELKTTVASLKREIRASDETITKLQKDLTELTESKSTCERRVRRLENQLERNQTAQALCSSMSDRLKVLENDCEQKTTDLKKAQRRLNELQSVKLVLEGTDEHTTSELCQELPDATIRKLLLNLKAQLTKTVNEKTAKCSKVDSLEQQIRQLKLENRKLTDERHTLREELKIRQLASKSTPCNPKVKKLLESTVTLTPSPSTDMPCTSRAAASGAGDSFNSSSDLFAKTKSPDPFSRWRDSTVDLFDDERTDVSPTKLRKIEVQEDPGPSGSHVRVVDFSPCAVNLPQRGLTSAVSARFNPPPGLCRKALRSPHKVSARSAIKGKEHVVKKIPSVSLVTTSSGAGYLSKRPGCAPRNGTASENGNAFDGMGGSAKVWPKTTTTASITTKNKKVVPKKTASSRSRSPIFRRQGSATTSQPTITVSLGLSRPEQDDGGYIVLD